MDKVISILATVVGVALMAAIIGVLIGYPVMWLINSLFIPHLIAVVFGVSRIDFWRAFGVVVLCGLLFKSNCTPS